MAAMGKETIHVLIVEDHALVRTGVRLLLQNATGFAVVGEAANCAQAIASAQKTKPDIVLLDIDLGGESGLDCLQQLIDISGAQIIIITAVSDLEVHRKAIALGARGVVHKAKTAEQILEAIRKVHQGELWLERSVMAGLLNDLLNNRRGRREDPEEAKINRLTAREKEVVELVGEGLKSKEIAEKLFISETTVRHHLTSIFSKLDVTDRVELMLFAYKNGLAKPPAAKPQF